MDDGDACTQVSIRKVVLHKRINISLRLTVVAVESWGIEFMDRC
jgi:hypothetical protein